MGEKPHILVASTSAHKIEAVENAADECFGEGCSITGVKAASGINEQPYGREETERGAMNRLNEAISKGGEADVAIAIESGIFPEESGTPPQTRYYDRAIAVARDMHSGTTSTATSKGVEFPADAVEEARARGFGTTTVGSVIAEENPGVDGTDPHSFLTHGKVSRGDQLAEVAKEALGGLESSRPS